MSDSAEARLTAFATGYIAAADRRAATRLFCFVESERTPAGDGGDC